MFQLLKSPSFDFMSRRNVLLGISTVLMVVSALVIGFRGLNLGIEFTGGTELQIKFVESPDIAGIRSALGDAGITGYSVTSIGDPDEHEVYIRLNVRDAEGDEDIARQVRDVLRRDLFGADLSRKDLNIEDEKTILNLISAAPGVSEGEAGRLAAAISERRREIAIFRSIDDFSSVQGMTPAIAQYLEANTTVGPLAARGQSFIGPAIGRELMQKALLAIFGSLIGMLIYIWIRFQLRWGFAAVVALAHDTLITLGLFSFFQKEMSLAVVAAFLTLVGYSVNDTVVVFDRIRENLRTRRDRDLVEVINISINQTLSRTIITSGLTWIVVFGLLVFGGAALNPFSFVLTVGVAVGTYSSVYIASPILVLWDHLVGQRKQGSGAAVSVT